jgi:hypothetical protein
MLKAVSIFTPTYTYTYYAFVLKNMAQITAEAILRIANGEAPEVWINK